MRNLPDVWRDIDQRYNPWRPLFRQFDELFNEALSPLGTGFSSRQDMIVPAVDVEESDDRFVLNFDMPGMQKENIDIEMQGNQLIVTGERKFEKETGEGRSRLVERRYGMFQRILTLPEGVNSETVEASYADGVLRVIVPKAPEAKAHKIQLGSGKTAAENQQSESQQPETTKH